MRAYKHRGPYRTWGSPAGLVAKVQEQAALRGITLDLTGIGRWEERVSCQHLALRPSQLDAKRLGAMLQGGILTLTDQSTATQGQRQVWETAGHSSAASGTALRALVHHKPNEVLSREDEG